jgi:3-oxoacyl-[acyl-carrier protein] reductase
MTGKLDGKVALVTGGSRGIGAAIAKRLAADGAAVALTYTTNPTLAEAVVADIHATGGRALAIAADSADADAVQQTVERVVAEFGGLDILVNNAGIATPGGVDSYALADFDRMVAVNVRAPFLAVQAALKYLPRGGRVINIGSNVAHRMPVGGMSVYTMTKAALGGLTRGLAHELGARGITINSVEPGPTLTDMSRPSIEGPRGGMLQSMMPVGRTGEVEEVAAMVAYLAGAETGYVTGARMLIDGGMSV